MTASDIASALRDARRTLESALESPGSAAQSLLCAVLGADRAHILAHPEHPLSHDQIAAYERLVARAAAGEPLPYILGRWAFYDRDLCVTPAVLIPRPETELLLERALAFSAAHGPGVAVDVGTGSGALAVTFAALRPDWQVYAVDVSPAALEVARRNAEIHGVGARITFIEGDLLAGFAADARFDLVMANLPYIPSARLPSLTVSRSEPLTALDGGADGLDLIRRLLAQASSRLNPRALLLLEIDYLQGAAVRALAQTALPGAQTQVLPDLAGLDRIVAIARAD
jgi:release factor glutamine methyltransferase